MSKTKHCKICNVVLNKSNRYESKNSKGSRKMCKDCFNKEKKIRYQIRTTFKNLYIERGRYPKTKVAIKLLPEDRDKWDQVRTLSTSPKFRLDEVEPGINRIVWMDSEFEEFKKGRDFFTSNLGGRFAREGYITKTGTKAGMYQYVFEGTQRVGHEYRTSVCTACGHDEIRYDERGYKYCTKCFTIQEGMREPYEPYESSTHESPDYRDDIFIMMYNTDDPKALGIR